MAGIKHGKDTIRSIKEFSKRYYPKSSAKKIIETSDDPKVIGISLAEKSLKAVKSQLSRM